MKAFSDEECAHWLAVRGIAADPYYNKSGRSSAFDQFRIPQHARGASAMFRSIVACAEPFESALLQVIDWSLYESDEMEMVCQVRRANGELRMLIEAPGHLFPASERDLLIGMVALVTSYRWSAYLYFDHGITLLSWEGDIMDVWRADGSLYRSIRDELQEMGIEQILNS